MAQPLGNLIAALAWLEIVTWGSQNSWGRNLFSLFIRALIPREWVQSPLLSSSVFSLTGPELGPNTFVYGKQGNWAQCFQQEYQKGESQWWEVPERSLRERSSGRQPHKAIYELQDSSLGRACMELTLSSIQKILKTKLTEYHSGNRLLSGTHWGQIWNGFENWIDIRTMANIRR